MQYSIPTYKKSDYFKHTKENNYMYKGMVRKSNLFQNVFSHIVHKGTKP